MVSISPAAIVLTVVGGDGNLPTKIAALTAWVHRNVRWSRTNYRHRSVEEVLRDGAGNCWDQSQVLAALLDVAQIRCRGVAEVNVEPLSLLRGAFAVWMVRKAGNGASVFGWRHNDHRWLEAALEDGTWVPVDASLGICDEQAWVRARLGFHDRGIQADAHPARAMIAPFVIVAPDVPGGVVDRTEEYLLGAFDRAYGGRLSGLNAWDNWRDAIRKARPLGAGALRGEINLHDHPDAIVGVGKAYQTLRKQALRAGVGAEAASMARFVGRRSGEGSGRGQ